DTREAALARATHLAVEEVVVQRVCEAQHYPEARTGVVVDRRERRRRGVGEAGQGSGRPVASLTGRLDRDVGGLHGRVAQLVAHDDEIALRLLPSVAHRGRIVAVEAVAERDEPAGRGD